LSSKLASLTMAAIVAGAAAVAPPAHADTLALTGGRIVPVVGEEIPEGTVLIEDGRIVAVGAEVEIPYDAMEVDCTGKVLFPGMINAHTWRGLDRPNENLPVAPFLDVYDAIDPSRSDFENALRNGITTVHSMMGNDCVIGGVSRAIRPIGLMVDEMTVEPDLAMKMSITPKRGYDRMRQLATFRETFRELDEYLENLAEKKYEESLAEEDKQIDVGPDEAAKRGRELITDRDYDDEHRNLVRLRRGDLDAWIYCGAPTDVKPAIELATEEGFLDQTVLICGVETYRAMGEISRSGRPVVLDDTLVHRDRDPITGEIEEVFIPKKFYDAGVMFALLPNPTASLAEQYPTYQAARCVRNGVPRQAALEAITINPAKMLGLGDRLGSIEPGKAANIVVMSGDPLDFSTWVEEVYIDGVLAYDREQDPRLKELLEVEAEAAALAEGEETAAAEAETDADDDGGDADASDSKNDDGRDGGDG